MTVRRPEVLVLRALGLGDFLTALPAVRGIRAALPHHDLTLATPPWLAPLVRLAGVAHRLVPVTGLQPLPVNEPHVAVNLHGKGPQSHRVLLATHPQRLIAFAHPELQVTGPQWQANEHEVHRWCRLVASQLGPCDPRHLDLPIPPKRALCNRAVVVHPGASSVSRRWPPERFAAVARAFAADGWPVLVTGSADERALTRRVTSCAGLPGYADVAGRLDVLALAALVSSASLVVAGDTGIAHLATAYRRPSVTLFGPVSPTLWGPPDRAQHAVSWHGGDALVPGDPHGQLVDERLLAIEPDEVISAGRALLSPRLVHRRMPAAAPVLARGARPSSS